MKKIFLPLLTACLLSSPAFSQSIAINTDGSAPHNSAMLDVKSTTKGLLLPRMTLAQRNAIGSPATGLMVYQTDNSPGFYHYNGAAWTPLSAGATSFWTQSGTHVYNNNTGNVGIGVTNPSFILDIKDRIRLRSNGTTAGLWLNDLGNTTTPAFVGLAYDDRVGFYGSTTGWGLLMNTSSGNVGIGTHTPDFKLTVVSSLVESNNNTHVLKLAGRNPVLALSDENGVSNSYIKSWTNAPYAPFSNGLVIGTNPGYPIFFSTNYSATMTVADNNKVGIGTTTPDFTLSVASNVVENNNNTNLMRLSGRNPVMVFTNEAGLANGYIKSWTNAPYAPFTNGLVIGAIPGYPIFLSTNNYGVSMTVADNGNVGIGTTTPTTKLAVNGTVRSKEVVVESGWADYVFNPGYKLRSLKEVDDFIRTNKHLPNIPSAKEVEEKGLSVGEMQKKMMEKIEELTLYLIESNRKMEMMNKEISVLKEKLNKSQMQ